MRRLTVFNSQEEEFIFVQGFTTIWFDGILVVNLTQYKLEQLPSVFFFLTVHQLIALAAWNSYKFGRVVKAHYQTVATNPQRLAEEIRKIKFSPSLLGGVVNADSYLVALLWLGLLRSGIPLSLLFHVTPAVVSTISIYGTGSNEAKIHGWPDFLRKGATLMGYTIFAGLATVPYYYLEFSNPDTGEHSVYPGYTDWGTKPVTAAICYLGVVTGSLLMPAASPIMIKVIDFIAKSPRRMFNGVGFIVRTCSAKFSESSTPLLGAEVITQPSSERSPENAVSPDSALSNLLPTPTESFQSPVEREPLSREDKSETNLITTPKEFPNLSIPTPGSSLSGQDLEDPKPQSTTSRFSILSGVVYLFTCCKRNKLREETTTTVSSAYTP